MRSSFVPILPNGASSLCRWLVLVLPLLFVVSTGRAYAGESAAPPARTQSRIVIEVVGQDADSVRLDATAALDPSKQNVSIVDGASFHAALKTHGQTVETLFSGTNAALLAEVEKAAADSGADAVVLARTLRTKSGKKLLVRVAFVSLHPGAILVDDILIFPTRPKTDLGELKSLLTLGLLGFETERSIASGPLTPARSSASTGRTIDTSLDRSSSTVSGDNATAAEEAPIARDAPSASAPRTREGGIGHVLFDVGAGFELGMRHFEYRDRLTPSLRSYDVDGVPLVAAEGQLYPLANVASGVLRDLGLSARLRRAVGLDSATTAGAAASTTWSELGVGARLRLRTGGPSRPVMYAALDYGATSFELTSDPPDPRSDLPSVRYRVLRAGVDGRFPIGPIVSVLGGVGYQAVLSAGPVSDRFPQSSQAGIDAQLGLAVALFQGLEARAMATYTRYFYDFSPEPGDRFVAGGALDQLGAIRVGLAYAK